MPAVSAYLLFAFALVLCLGCGSGSGTKSAATLVSINLSAQKTQLELGEVQQLSAVASYSNGATEDISTAVTWNAESPYVSVKSGVAAGRAVGVGSVSATLGTISGSVSLTVTAPQRGYALVPWTECHLPIPVLPRNPDYCWAEFRIAELDPVTGELRIPLTTTGHFELGRCTCVPDPGGKGNVPCDPIAFPTRRWNAAPKAGNYFYWIDQAWQSELLASIHGAQVSDLGLLSPCCDAAFPNYDPNVTPWIVDMEADPTFTYLFTIRRDSASIYVDRIGGPAAQAPVTPEQVAGSPFRSPPVPTAVAVHPNGRFVYVTSEEANAISIYSLGADGTLLLTGTALSGLSPSSIVIDPTGSYAYVTNRAENSVYGYSINATSGALIFLGSTAVTDAPVDATIDVSGRFLYVVVGNSTAEFGIDAFAIDLNLGTLAALPPLHMLGSFGCLAKDVAGEFLYVGHHVFRIDAATGALALTTSGWAECPLLLRKPKTS